MSLWRKLRERRVRVGPFGSSTREVAPVAADEPYARRSIGFLPPEARESAYELVRRRRDVGPPECSHEAEAQAVEVEVEVEEDEEDES